MRLISAAQTQPTTSAATLFPKAAAANTAVFYDRQTGAARSVSEVYKFLVAKHDGTAARLAATPGVTQTGLPVPAAPVTSPLAHDATISPLLRPASPPPVPFGPTLTFPSANENAIWPKFCPTRPPAAANWQELLPAQAAELCGWTAAVEVTLPVA